MQRFARLDPTGMYECIRDFHLQAADAVKIGKDANLKALSSRGISSIVLTGLGGSAIGGDLLRAYLSKDLNVPLLVNRDYQLPSYVGRSTLVIVSSYSGNTEETTAAYQDARKKKARILCITTGGDIGRAAKRYGHTLIVTKSGLQPRAALAYSFFPLLIALARLGFVSSKAREIKETIHQLANTADIFGNPDSDQNLPAKLAAELQGKLAVIYSPSELLDAVNLRWRGQIDENAKHLAFGNVLPEMNHNELVGWNSPADVLKQLGVIFLSDSTIHKRVRYREDITKNLLSGKAGFVRTVSAQGKSKLARMFYLIHFGDWLSFYLAMSNGVDPTPVKVIDYLKSELGKLR